MEMAPHQYIDRKSGRVCTETLYGDRAIEFIYSSVRERAPVLFKTLVSGRMSRLLGYVNYDSRACARLTGAWDFVKRAGIDLSECMDDETCFQSLRDVFERKIRYWETRPMPGDLASVVSPADARMIVGSFQETSSLFIKNKFFALQELLGESSRWSEAFDKGPFAVFRLTPDKYHYNHLPVSGIVRDFYEIDGIYHSCNPRAMISVAGPASRNKRVITIIDTDVEGGSGAGLVAMVEVVALMIGDIAQCYSENAYDLPVAIERGMFVKRGRPKSLYRPGSSTDILVFEKGRIRFSEDIVSNLNHPSAFSRFALGLGRPLVETEVSVREEIGSALRRPVIPEDFSAQG